jgi:hypothetical protein
MCCPPRRPLNRSFLSYTDVLTAAPFDAPRVSFCYRRLAHRASSCTARFFLSLTACPQRRSLHNLFLSLADVLPAVPLGASLVSFTRQSLACPAARCIACYLQSLTSLPPLRSQHRLILSLVDVLPAAPLAESLDSFPCQRLARCAARCIV